MAPLVDPSTVSLAEDGRARDAYDKLLLVTETASSLTTKLSKVTNIGTGLRSLQTLQEDAAQLTQSAPPNLPTMLALRDNLEL